jgi:hypothetical protein
MRIAIMIKLPWHAKPDLVPEGSMIYDSHEGAWFIFDGYQFVKLFNTLPEKSALGDMAYVPEKKSIYAFLNDEWKFYRTMNCDINYTTLI